jgi:hypothetical protein
MVKVVKSHRGFTRALSPPQALTSRFNSAFDSLPQKTPHPRDTILHKVKEQACYKSGIMSAEYSDDQLVWH